jgi:redox-sensitive bicupin YhaK (pirin superfamily)
MTKIFYPAKNRGGGDFGWLKTNYHFSFSNWYNPDQMNFGKLRVLNDDTIAPGGGFPTHPHEDMEIITILLEGSLAHKDSTGSEGIIKTGEIQAMSAGTGIFHSEFNPSDSEYAKLFQLWIMPKEYGIKPRYEQKEIDFLKSKNRWTKLVSNNSADKNTIFINQDANIRFLNIEKDREVKYTKELDGNGTYFLLIEGDVKIDNQDMKDRDALGLTNFTNTQIKANSDSKILAIEIPV